VNLFSRLAYLTVGLLTVFMISTKVSLHEQGLYYLFSSLIALQIFADLGLSYCVMLFNSHTMAKLKWKNNNFIAGDEIAINKLSAAFKFSLRWSGATGICFFIVLLFLGYVLTQGIYIEGFSLLTVWIGMVSIAALNIPLSMTLSFIEGCSKVYEISIIRMSQVMASGTTLIIFLYLDYGVKSLLASLLVNFIIGIIFIAKYHLVFLKVLVINNSTNTKENFNWKAEIFPFQFKIAISWICGYVMFQSITPIVFHIDGPEMAGKVGMSMQIVSAINGTAALVLTSRSSDYGTLIAKGLINDFNAIYYKLFLFSSIFLIILIIIASGSYLFIHFNYPIYTLRLVETTSLIILCICCTSTHIVTSMAVYFRSYKKDPFYVISIAQALSLALSILILHKFVGSGSSIIAYLISTTFIGLGLGLVYSLSRRKYFVTD